MTPLNNERRVQQREPVEWTAYCDFDSSTITGRVRDWSTGGLFFHPEEAFLDGQFLHGVEILDGINEGDEFRIILQEADTHSPRTFSGTARWVGRGAWGHGFGICFQPDGGKA